MERTTFGETKLGRDRLWFGKLRAGVVKVDAYDLVHREGVDQAMNACALTHFCPHHHRVASLASTWFARGTTVIQVCFHTWLRRLGLLLLGWGLGSFWGDWPTCLCPSEKSEIFPPQDLAFPLLALGFA